MSSFSLLIRKWYRQNKRDLPWRSTQNPYFIWLSEVILQQTRVDQGLPYYLKFTETFPTVFDLAHADENKVLNLWQGLGYYSRARNLHTAAKQIVENYKGKFPKDYKSIRSLKGVGDYTAAAISSFCYELPYPVVDGNVYRVIARYFNEATPIDTTEGKKTINQFAEEVFDASNPSEHNQAIMELGALICTPKQPKCESCPLQESCLAYRSNTVTSLPQKAKKTKVTKRYFNYLVDNDSPVLYKRVGQGIWKNMYEFPLIETCSPIEDNPTEQLTSNDWTYTNLVNDQAVFEQKHVLSHQHIYAAFWLVEGLSLKNNTLITQPFHKKEDYPLPRIISRFIEAFH